MRALRALDRHWPAVAGALGGVAVAACWLLFPDDPPGGVLLRGAISGCRNALIAAGILIVYRTSRVVNFAHLALGVIGGTVMFNLGAVGIEGVGRLPFAVAFVAAIVVSLVFGLVIELVFVRRFFDAPRLVLTVVTIVAAPTIVGLAGRVVSLPFWSTGPAADEVRRNAAYPSPAPGLSWQVGPVVMGFAELLTVVLTLVGFGGLAWFMHRTRLGMAIRGASENPDRALLLGINVKLLSTVVWGIAAVLSAFAAMASGFDAGFATGTGFAPEQLLVPLAALVLARMSSLTVAFGAAVTLGVLEQAIAWSFPGSLSFRAVVLVAVLGGLYLQRGRYSRIDGATTAWRATREVRPTPVELLEVGGVRAARLCFAVAGAVAVVVFPLATSASQATTGARIAINVVVALSLVVLTGWGGHVSLGQFALVAVGAVVAGRLTSVTGLSFWVAVPLAALAGGAVAAVIGQPALRMRGPFLAVSTLAFADAAVRFLFESSSFDWLDSRQVERPTLLFLSFAGERSYYYLCVTVAVVVTLLLRRLRAGRPGRVLIAIREDEFGVQPFGIDAGRTRLAVFALGGGLAGTAGALLVHLDRGVGAGAFEPVASVDAFVMAMIGGVGSVAGGVLGAVYTGLAGLAITDPQVQRLANSGGLLVLLFLAPGGLAAVLASARDGVLRIVAQRRGLVVPSLFPETDLARLEKGQTVLGPPIEGRGLEALPAGTRYRLGSDLYAPEPESRSEPLLGPLAGPAQATDAPVVEVTGA